MPRKAQPKAPSIEKRPNPVILWQADAVIVDAEATINEAIENGGEVPEAAGQRIAVMVAERQNAVDRIIHWLTQKEDAIEFAKSMAQGWRDIAANTEKAKAAISTFIQNYIDDPANKERVTEGNKLVGSVLKLWTQKSNDKLVIEEDLEVPKKYVFQEFRVRAYGEIAEEVGAALAAFVEAYQSSEPGEPVATYNRVSRSPEDYGTEGSSQLLPAWETIDTSRVRAALNSGKEVPGAKITSGRHLRHTKISRNHLVEIGGLPGANTIEATSEPVEENGGGDDE